ncbi:ribonuclease 3 [Variibacter gotjawalensis]|uniref:Ribonuclease 3 n=2 Tax=Variibacter gotjawalensis TaxID=1333996 RepID=A0A0S3PXS6_9BRAD|nr:ribonuclease III [Variibacter gotjawalensis]RZS48464.1 RNAse III [Variibacter gotjawalensis]BAT60726.1 ribonuclease 3 [Variibacter gotjawalensis]
MSRKATAARQLQTRIGYEFTQFELLERAVSHSTALSGGDKTGSYQRLEFLGDRVLGLAIASMLFEAFPDANEGDLSRRLAELVRAETCTEVAKAMEADQAIRLGTAKGVKARLSPSIMADVAEAIIGAVYLDGGYAPAAALVQRYWAERVSDPAMPLRDPKTTLQEWAQGGGLPMPVYTEVDRSGPDHNPRFTVEVAVARREPTQGTGKSKRAAEQAAALAMLAREGVTQE